jgi:cell division protein FtsL
MTREQRLHRETDPRVGRSFGLTAVCAICLVVAALVVVAVRVHQVRLAYQLDALRAERARVETLIGQLEVQVATLRSPRRLESQARQLGLTMPSAQQVVNAREFVAGRGGLAAGRSAQIEAQVR